MPSLDRAAIDPDADRVVRKLTRAGHKAYLVGGCVRDLLVAKTPKDFDVATSATPNEIKSTFRNFRIIGRRFRLAHVVFGAKIIETSTFRANPRDEDDHDLLIRRDNVFGNETEDARRRDFTINGLVYDVEREQLIDDIGGPAEHDPDDPPDEAEALVEAEDDEDEDDDEEDGEEEEDDDDEEEDDDAIEPAAAASLDDEEQAWHRVWADEPAARPAAAAAVRL